MIPGYGVHRLKPLPVGSLQGCFIISEPIIGATRDALIRFALLGIEDGGHEGLVLWAGREMNGLTIFSTVIIPEVEHSSQRVWINEANVARASQAARGKKLGVLSQVHSHPGSDARHSSGDDDMILMPFEGMLSIVVPNYGIDFSRMEQACVHQFQKRRWVLCTARSVSENLHVAPTVIDLQ